MKKQDFTLIELLVIIAVISILASLLLPALSRSKEATKRIHCVGNVRQMALASHLYADDHSDWMPNPFTRIESESWDTLLLDSYLDENTNLFQCPANSRHLQETLANPFFQSLIGLSILTLRDGRPIFNFVYDLSSFCGKPQLDCFAFGSYLIR